METFHIFQGGWLIKKEKKYILHNLGKGWQLKYSFDSFVVTTQILKCTFELFYELTIIINCNN